MTTPTQGDDELTAILENVFMAGLGIAAADDIAVEDHDRAILNTQKHYVAEAKAALTAHIRRAEVALLEDLSMAVVEPCEPDCDAVRHALHQGSWNAHLVIEERIDQLKGADSHAK